MTNLVTQALAGSNGGFTGFNDRLFIPAAAINQAILAGPGLITVTIQSAASHNGTLDGLAIGTAGGIINTPSGINFTGDQVQTLIAGVASKSWAGVLTFTSDATAFTYAGPGTGLLVSTHWSGTTDTGATATPGYNGCNQYLSGASQLLVTNPSGSWSNDGSWTWVAAVDFTPNPVPPKLVIQSDHATAELAPGYPSPGAQPPLAALAALFGTSLPPLATPRAMKPSINLLQPPVQSGKPPAMTQAVLAVPAGLTGLAQNLLPFVPLRVLGIDADDCEKGKWVIPIPIVGKSSLNLRCSYRDLHIDPGIRGLMLYYPTGIASVLITCNATGMTHYLGAGPLSGWVPLYMLEDGIDLTITANAPFPVGSTALLTSDIAPWR